VKKQNLINLKKTLGRVVLIEKKRKEKKRKEKKRKE